MAVGRLIKHSVASCIANSTHKLPSGLTRWADDKIAALEDDKQSESATVYERSQPSQQGYHHAAVCPTTDVSSSSTLPVLQLQFEPTAVTPIRSCLKKSQDRYYRTDKPKRVGFIHSDSLATCMETGNTWRPAAKNAELRRRTSTSFHAITKAMAAANNTTTAAAPADNHASATANPSLHDCENTNPMEMDEQGPENTKLAQDSEEALAQQQQHEEDRDTLVTLFAQLTPITPAQQALFDAQDKVVDDSTKLAGKVKSALEMHATANGSLDFALYVTRDAQTLEDLADMAHKYKHVTRIASFRGDERRYALCGQQTSTVVPVELYDDCRTSMSGCKLVA